MRFDISTNGGEVVADGTMTKSKKLANVQMTHIVDIVDFILCIRRL